MTYLRVVSCGLIAGLQKSEIDRMAPGKVLTLYEYRKIRTGDGVRDKDVRKWP